MGPCAKLYAVFCMCFFLVLLASETTALYKQNGRRFRLTLPRIPEAGQVFGLFTVHQRLDILVLRAAGAEDMDWDPKSAPKLDFNEDYYSVIEGEQAMTSRELKKAYVKIVFKYHPDNKEESAKALCNKQMMVINNAYQVLKEDDTRADYDRKRRLGGVGGNGKSSDRNSRTSSQGGSSTSSSSSSSAYKSAAWGGYTGNTYTGKGQTDPFADEEPSESFGDIFSDLFKDIRGSGGTAALEDMMEFLEGMGVGGQSWTGDSDIGSSSSYERQNARSRSELEAEISVLRTASSNLESHLSDLKKLRMEAERELLRTKPAENAAPNLEVLESRMKKIESLRGLKARQEEVDRQLKQLRRKLKNTQEILNYQTGSDSSTNRNSRTSETPPRQQNPGQSTRYDENPFTPGRNPRKSSTTKVEQELQALKNKLGMK